MPYNNLKNLPLCSQPFLSFAVRKDDSSLTHLGQNLRPTFRAVRPMLVQPPCPGSVWSPLVGQLCPAPGAECWKIRKTQRKVATATERVVPAVEGDLWLRARQGVCLFASHLGPPSSQACIGGMLMLHPASSCSSLGRPPALWAPPTTSLSELVSTDSLGSCFGFQPLSSLDNCHITPQRSKGVTETFLVQYSPLTCRDTEAHRRTVICLGTHCGYGCLSLLRQSGCMQTG